jgi:hypothetical protein
MGIPRRVRANSKPPDKQIDKENRSLLAMGDCADELFD